MNIQSQINVIKNTLTNAFSNIENWIEKDNVLQHYQPINGSWTIGQIIEHIYLTNHFLLIIIDKAFKKALKRANNVDLEQELKDYDFLRTDLEQIGTHLSFTWNRPKHMIPKGNITLTDLQNRLNIQKNQCIEYLNQMPNGEGVLCKTTMTVNNLGKIDVYQYLYFLAMHIQRHLEQMMKIENEFKN